MSDATKWWQLPPGDERDRLKAESETTYHCIATVGDVVEYRSDRGRHFFESKSGEWYSFDSRDVIQRRVAYILASGDLVQKSRNHRFYLVGERLLIHNRRNNLATFIESDTPDEYCRAVSRIRPKRKP